MDLTTDKKLEDVIGPSMQGGDYPDVVHLATGREAALTEQSVSYTHLVSAVMRSFLLQGLLQEPFPDRFCRRRRDWSERCR